MPKNKHRKFAEINIFPNVVQPEYKFPVSDYGLKGKWNEQFFYNNNPIVLEIGCGKGEYTVGLARAYPHLNFIGIDIKGNRMHTGAKTALEEGMANVGFLRVQAEHLTCFFASNEVEGIWITFPDPQPNKPREKKRLTSPAFLERYRQFLKPGCPVYLKTDNRPLYDYTLEVIQNQNLSLVHATSDLYNQPGKVDPMVLSIQTYYESKFLEKGEMICFLEYGIFPAQPV